MNQTIRRDRYLQKLIDRKENGLVKVITGIRRCGKSLNIRRSITALTSAFATPD
mgnify:CR=1 FL=1